MESSYTLATALIGKHEILLFNEHLEIEDPLIQFDENPNASTRDHVHLDFSQVRDLRTFLNQPENIAIFEQ